MKNYVFGDTGGHAPQLFGALEELGIDWKTGVIPDGVRIIHCGDLIHKGPNSKVLLAVVDTLIRNNPGQWIQILGNHEFQHIKGSPYFWRCDCDQEDVNIINEWFEEGLATATFAVDSAVSFDVAVKPVEAFKPETGIFFSHAGLTRRWWQTYFKNQTLKGGSDFLNRQDVYMLTQPGEMLTGRVNLEAGPVWATGNNEVFNSWVNPDTGNVIDMPFIQVHGHTSSYLWKAHRWWDRKDPEFRQFKAMTKLDQKNRAVVTSMAHGTLVGIDPGYNTTADTQIQPYISFATK
jgi:hypothetical protein